MNNLLSTGSSAVEENHSPLMEENYKEVIYFLEQKLIREPKCVTSIREWIFSYHALAEIYQQRGELDLAQQCLFIPHKSMLYMAQCYAHDDEFESIAASAMGLTLPPLMQLAQVYQPCDHCMQELRAQQAALKNDTKIYH